MHPFNEKCQNCEVKDFFLNALNNLDSCIEIVNKDGYIIVSSKGFVERHNLKQDNILGKHLSEVYNLDETSSMPLKSLKEKKIIENHYSEYVTMNNKKNYSLISSFPIYSKNKKVIGSIATGTDITKIKELSEQILLLQKKLYSNLQINNSNGTQFTFKDIIGTSKSIKSLKETAEKVAGNISPVMLIGETGTGKELFAQSIHNSSPRRNGPFVAIDCSSIPETLLESLLFGTIKGAYTGSENKKGLLEEANEGTLFLDEINSMDLSLQKKLLRVLQTKKIRRLGDNKEININTRVISATNIDPFLAVEKEILRKDLFYRLAVVTLEIPSLKERNKDINVLVKNFITQYNKVMGKKISDISRDVTKIISQHDWPGNVRELEHVIEHSMNMVNYSDNLIKTQHLPQYLRSKHTGNFFNNNTEITDYKETIQNFEKEIIKKALEQNNYNITKTAKKLKISRQHLYNRIKKFDI